MRALTARTLLLTASLGLGPLGLGGCPTAGWGWADAQASAAPVDAQPGSFLSLLLEVGGLGAGVYEVGGELPENWALLTTQVELEPGADRMVLALHLPDTAQAGTYPLVFTLRGEGGAARSVPAGVRVAALPDLLLSLPAGDRVRPGERRSYTARVTNTGNARDTLRLTVEGGATVTPGQLTLEPGESGEARLSYAQQGQGNADLLTLRATSELDPRVVREATLAISVGAAPAQGSGPQLNWQVTLAPEVSGARVRPPGTALPALPGLPTGGEPPATATPPALDPASPAWTWGGGFSAVLGGQLSDYATGAVGYSVRRRGAEAVDSGLAQLDWGNLNVTATSRDTFSQVDLGASYRRGDYRFGVNVGRSAAPGEAASYSVGASVTHRYGAYLAASHTFGEPGGDALSVGWTRTLGAFTPTLEVSAVRSGERWGYSLRQQLDYENRVLLARQDYRYDSLSGSQQLDLRVSARTLDPFGVSAGLSVSRVAGVTRYDLSGQVSYRPDESFGVNLRANSGSGGPRALLDARKDWRVGQADVYLGTQVSYAPGNLGGNVQAAAVLPWQDGELLLSGLVGYGGALYYGAGAGYVRGPFSVAGGAQRSGLTTRATLSAAYRPERGLYATADAVLRRGAPSNQELDGQEVRGSVGYTAERWAAGVLLGYAASPTQPGQLVYGATVSAQPLPSLTLQARAERSADRTRLAVGGRFTPAGAVRTPAAVVKLFGGRNAGTLQLRAFLDGNRNGTREAGEPGLASRFLVGGQIVETDAQGGASLLLKPGSYDVELGGEVLAQYLLTAPAPVAVTLKGTTTVSLPVRQVGSAQGRLTDDQGRAVTGAPVQFTGLGETLSATTDAAGYYRLGGLGFGTYTVNVEADPALYHPLPPERLTVSADQALLSFDPVLRSVYEASTLSEGGLSLQVSLPQTPLPPGAAFAVRVEADPAVDAVRLEGLGDPRALSSSDGGRVWTGDLILPLSQQSSTEVQIIAQRGTESGSERGLLLVDPGLPAASLQVSPLHALPGQSMSLRTVLFLPGSRVEVRDEQGRGIPLQGGNVREQTTSFLASTTPGSHRLTLLVNGEVRAEASYMVLGRP